jgi:hypothetical protein
MKKVLIIGLDPTTIDFANPEIPPGLTIEKIQKGTEATLKKLRSQGYDAELFLVKTSAADRSNLTKQLKDKSYMLLYPDTLQRYKLLKSRVAKLLTDS